MKFWNKVETPVLAQGDHLPGCFVPILPANFSEMTAAGGNEAQLVPVTVVNLMVMTQSCDLENHKAPFVACCPIHTLAEFETTIPASTPVGGNKFASAAWKVFTC